MSPPSVFVAALLAPTAFAASLMVRANDGEFTSLTLKANNGEITPCPATHQGQKLVGQLGYYSDHDCTKGIYVTCSYAPQALLKHGPGWYGCKAAQAPSHTPYYAKVLATNYENIQFVFTDNQSCPPTGPGAVFATLVDNRSCVQMNVGGSAPGLTIYPKGGAPIPRAVEKRTVQCKGFKIHSSQPSDSRSVQLSNIVDCTNGAPGGCTISKGEERSQSVTTSYSVTAGGGIEGLFEVSTTFGMDYTMSETTSTQLGFSIPRGQKGFLSAYCAATLFKGVFTGCESGPSQQPGEALVLKKRGFTYAVVLTGD